MIPFDLSPEEQKLLLHVLPWRLKYMERQLHKFERRQLHKFDAGRQGRIDGTVIEIGKLVDLIDRLDSDTP